MANRKIILALSGEICTGKTTLSNRLQEFYGFKPCKTKEGIRIQSRKILKRSDPDRKDLQSVGEKLDKKTNGRWVLDFFQEQYSSTFEQDDYFVIDSIRIIDQIKYLREAYSYIVFHVHLEADPNSLRDRYLSRYGLQGEDLQNIRNKYLEYKMDPTEMQVTHLREDADLVINTDKCTEHDVFIRVSSFLRLLPPIHTPLVDVIIGGQFGSEGKGQVSAHLAPEYDCLIRVGGPNAGHTVYEKPNKHVFHMLPSGSYRNQQAKIIIGPGSVFNLEKILEEIGRYDIEPDRLVIDENSTVISEEDIKNEMDIRHIISSTGQGVGFATANNIIARLRGVSDHKARHFKEIEQYIGSATAELEKLYRRNEKILVEGTQGSGLSLFHGLYPHVTSRDTNVSGILSETGISPKRVRKVIMVTRTYPIRVGGTSGGFVSRELTWETIAERSGKDIDELRTREITTTTARDRRVAEFSWTMFRRACELNSPTDIALTFTDYLSSKNEKARRYDQLTSETRQMIEELERCSGVKVSLIGTCFDYRAIIDRRYW
jgi:adenylosuccinate synthase